MVTGYAVGGGGFNNAVSWLRTNNYLVVRGDVLESTPAGIEALGMLRAIASLFN